MVAPPVPLPENHRKNKSIAPFKPFTSPLKPHSKASSDMPSSSSPQSTSTIDSNFAVFHSHSCSQNTFSSSRSSASKDSLSFIASNHWRNSPYPQPSPKSTSPKSPLRPGLRALTRVENGTSRMRLRVARREKHLVNNTRACADFEEDGDNSGDASSY